MSRRPKYIPRRLWLEARFQELTDRVWQFGQCNILRRHTVKMSTYPNCIWCGKRAER